jgi:hypothetical protein
MTSKQYHHEIKANDKSHHRQFQVQRNGLGEWQTQLRTMKTHSVGSIIESLRDLFQLLIYHACLLFASTEPSSTNDSVLIYTSKKPLKRYAKS